MKFLVVLAAAVALVSADVSHIVKTDESVAPIVRSDYDISPNGDFQYAVETGNGIAFQAEGVVKNPNTEDATLEVKGQVHYTDRDGTPFDLTYVANEGGYQPSASYLPVAPPIPEAILRSLEFIAAHPPQVEYKKTV